MLPSGASSIDDLELRVGSVGALLIGALLPSLNVARKAINTGKLNMMRPYWFV